MSDETIETVDTAPEGTLSEAPAPAPEVATDAPSAEDTMREVYQRLNPPRDPNTGKFTSRNGAEPATEPAPEIPDQAQTETVEQAVPAIDMPKSWSADRAAIWEAMSPEAREVIAQREQDAHKQISQQGQQIAQFEPVTRILEQYAGLFQRTGVNVETGLANLLNAAERMDSNPRAAIQYFADTYGVDLREMAGLQPGEGATPETAQLLNHIRQLEARLDENSQRIDRDESLRQQAELKSVQEKIDAFSKDKPDWADLEKDVMTEIVGLKASIASGLIPQKAPEDILALAYERAQKNNPDAWAKKVERDRKEAEKKRIEEAQKTAKDVRKSAPLKVKPSVANAPANQSMEDTMRAAFRSAQAR